MPAFLYAPFTLPPPPKTLTASNPLLAHVQTFESSTLPRLPTFNCQALSTCLWSMARWGHSPGPDWLAGALDQMQQSMASTNPKDLASSVWAMAVLDVAASSSGSMTASSSSSSSNSSSTGASVTGSSGGGASSSGSGSGSLISSGRNASSSSGIACCPTALPVRSPPCSGPLLDSDGSRRSDGCCEHSGCSMIACRT